MEVRIIPKTVCAYSAAVRNDEIIKIHWLPLPYWYKRDMFCTSRYVVVLFRPSVM